MLGVRRRLPYRFQVPAWSSVQHRVVHHVIHTAPGKAATERARKMVVVEARVADRDGRDEHGGRDHVREERSCPWRSESAIRCAAQNALVHGACGQRKGRVSIRCPE